MGSYSARGVVRGSRVFLALSSGGYVYYTVFSKERRHVERILLLLGSL
jgi:hypothetical protein